MKRRYVFILVAGAVVLVLAAAAMVASLGRRPSARYQVTFLPSLGGFRTDPHAINNRGQVIGVAEAGGGRSYIFLWDKEHGLQNLGRFDDPVHVCRLYINDEGHVAGTITDPNTRRNAFLWDLSTGKRMLGTLGGPHSIATGLNNKDQVIGEAETSIRYRHGFVWDASGGMRDLGTFGGPSSIALGINDAGQIVGMTETAERRCHIVVWDPVDGTIDLGPAGSGPYLCEINNRGLVIRRLGTVTGKTYFMTWTKEAGSKQLSFVAVDSGMPCGLNDAGQFLITAKPTMMKVFGRILRRRFQCYLWDPNEGAVSLREELPIQGIQHLTLTDLNNQGMITGMLRTEDSSSIRAVVIEPVVSR